MVNKKWEYFLCAINLIAWEDLSQQAVKKESFFLTLDDKTNKTPTIYYTWEIMWIEHKKQRPCSILIKSNTLKNFDLSVPLNGLCVYNSLHHLDRQMLQTMYCESITNVNGKTHISTEKRDLSLYTLNLRRSFCS